MKQMQLETTVPVTLAPGNARTAISADRLAMSSSYVHGRPLLYAGEWQKARRIVRCSPKYCGLSLGDDENVFRLQEARIDRCILDER